MAAATTSPSSTRKVRRARAALAIEIPTGLGQLSTAAARKIKDQPPRKMERQKWQEEAYGHVDFIGELGYVVGQVSDVVARGDLVIIQRDLETGDIVQPDKDDEGNDIIEGDRAVAEKAMLAFRGPGGDSSTIMRAIAEADMIAGEGHLVGTPLDAENQIVWEFLSIMEITRDSSSGKQIRKRHAKTQSVTGEEEVLDENTYVSRYHRRDPRHSGDATSSIRRVAATCREVVLLTQLIEATIKSHIPAGILLVADELSLPLGPDDETVDDDEDIDPLLEVLTEHLSAPIEDRQSAASLVPLLLNAPADVLDKALKLVKLDAERMDPERIISLRENSLGRIATGIDVPPEIMSGMGGLNHWCLYAGDMIYTSRGWVDSAGFQVGDVVLTLNHETGESEWHATTDVYRAGIEEEPMVRIPVLDLEVTPDHSWPVIRSLCGACGEMPSHSKGRCQRCYKRAWRACDEGPKSVGHIEPVVRRLMVRAADLLPSDALAFGAPHCGLPIEPKYTDAMVELLAWFSTDGCTTNRNQGVVRGLIRQSPSVNPESCQSIERAFRVVFGDPVDRLSRTGSRPDRELNIGEWRTGFDKSVGCNEYWMSADTLGMLAESFGRISDGRFLVAEHFIRDLTRSQLSLFLDTVHAANGNHSDTGSGRQKARYLFAKDPDRLAAAELAAILLGFRTGRARHLKAENRQGFRKSDIWRLAWMGSKINQQVGKIEHVTRTGEIWCPTVPPTHTFLVRPYQGGPAVFTGNTGATVSKDFIEKHIIPPGDRIVQFLTIAYLRRILMDAEDWAEERAEQFEISYEAGGLLTRADAAASADALYRDRLLSEDSRLRAHGFDPDRDKPKEDERLRRYVEAISLAASVTNKPFLAALGLTHEALVEMGMDPDAADALLSPSPPPEPDADIPDEDPPEPGEPGVNEDPAAREDSPAGGPETPTTSSPEQLARIKERIRVAASERLTAALNRAAGLAIQRIPSDSLDTKDRCRSLPKLEVLAAIPASDWRKMKVRPDKLIDRPWTQFQGLTVGWLREYFEASVLMPHLDADEAAHRIASEVVVKLDELYLAGFQKTPFRDRDGLYFPEGFVDEVVLRHLAVALK